jgi:hypothetical protein
MEKVWLVAVLKVFATSCIQHDKTKGRWKRPVIRIVKYCWHDCEWKQNKSLKNMF